MQRDNPRKGAALVVVLWVLMMLSVLIGSFAFDMHVEARIAAYYRKRLKAQYLARAGVEYAKAILHKNLLSVPSVESKEPSANALCCGVPIRQLRRSLGEGTFAIDLVPEEGRRNVNLLDGKDWEKVFSQADVPEEKWAALIDCFMDWTDKGDLADTHRLNGAGSDDPYYVGRGYRCKRGPLDIVDELLLIKNFTPAIVYGGPLNGKGGGSCAGIAKWLTVWGDGKVNINAASREVLLTLNGIDEGLADSIIAWRRGLDGVDGTDDDGFRRIDDVMNKVALPDELKSKLTTHSQYMRVTSVGEVQGLRYGIWCVLEVVAENMASIDSVYWREGDIQ
jgi:type II secretory pathway component PulK